MPPAKQLAIKRRTGGGKKKKRLHLASIRPSSMQSFKSNDGQETSPLTSGDTCGPSTFANSVDRSLPSSPHPRPSTPESTLTASASKLQAGERFFNQMPASSSSLPTTVVDLNCLRPLFAGLRCGNCRQGHLDLIMKGDPQGLSVCLTLRCVACLFERPSVYTSPREDDRSHKINRAVVTASLAGGFGYAGLQTFSEYLNMPLICQSSFQVHADRIHTKAMDYKQDILAESVKKVREHYIRLDPAREGKDVIDISVSYDGSWHKRGHTSNNGIGCVIEIKTSLVIDYHVMSKFCKLCVTEGERVRKESESVYAEWKLRHESVCSKNFNLSSGAMEVEAALVCWRSLDRGLQYINVISDGDCKTIKKINEEQPYGPSIEVQKEECVNHVAKRLGKALRTLVDTKKKQRVTLGGRGDGKLTQTKMNRLQKYYARAIRSNDTLEGMKESVMAIFFHCTSTDAHPQHESCPEGAESWCFYQRALARDETPPSHQLKLGSLHSVLWSRCPKNIFLQRNRLETSIAVAIGEFNEGSAASRKFMLLQGLGCGDLSVKYGMRRDRRRIYFSSYWEDSKNKERKEKQEAAKKAERAFISEQEIAVHGGPLYDAGGADDE